MREIRNSDGRLVCMVNENTGAVEICIKGCVTIIERAPNGEIKVINSKK